jgi:hypothetical protein
MYCQKLLSIHNQATKRLSGLVMCSHVSGIWQINCNPWLGPAHLPLPHSTTENWCPTACLMVTTTIELVEANQLLSSHTITHASTVCSPRICSNDAQTLLLKLHVTASIVLTLSQPLSWQGADQRTRAQSRLWRGTDPNYIPCASPQTKQQHHCVGCGAGRLLASIRHTPPDP